VSGHGDFAFAVPALPQARVIFVVNLPDDEFPAEITVLFDSSIVRRLPAEDITIICQMICLKLVRMV
jgi:hypothetical protein